MKVTTGLLLALVMPFGFVVLTGLLLRKALRFYRLRTAAAAAL